MLKNVAINVFPKVNILIDFKCVFVLHILNARKKFIADWTVETQYFIIYNNFTGCLTTALEQHNGLLPKI